MSKKDPDGNEFSDNLPVNEYEENLYNSKDFSDDPYRPKPLIEKRRSDKRKNSSNSRFS